jgi:hypothetical protein
LMKKRARWQSLDSHMILHERVRWSGRSGSFVPIQAPATYTVNREMCHGV